MKKKQIHPRVIILGIDGLEYSLVRKWKLTNIMQKIYCKTDLSDYKVIVTPPIWGSMLTGKIDEEIMGIWEKQAELTGCGVNTKQKWWAKIGNFLPPVIGLWIWCHFFSPFFGGNLFDKASNYVIEKNQINIFQFFKNPWTNGIPGYGRNVSDPKARYHFQLAMIGINVSFHQLDFCTFV